MNLALFPITALLLLLSGVGTPAHPDAGRASATALIKAILGNAADVSATPRQTAVAPWHIHGRQAAWARLHAAPAAASECIAPRQCNRLGSLNRKAYRARFGFVEGAYQPQGPPPAARTSRS